MKAGNSILAVFFFYMAFRIPMEISNLSLAYDIPEAEFFKVLSVILFGACITLGCVSLEYGRESRKKTIKQVTDNEKTDKKLSDVAAPLKNSMSDNDRPMASEVDKNLPVLEVVDEKDDFTEVSNNINNVIRSK